MKSYLNARNTKGFSLLEITIALVLMVVGLVSVLHLFPAGLRAGKRAGLINEATICANERMEDVKRIGLFAMNEWKEAEVQAVIDGAEPPEPPIPMAGREESRGLSHV